jgi:hypothetical protein
MTGLVSWAAEMCRHPWPCVVCRPEPKPYVPPAPGIGIWDPCLKPGPCPCASPCKWVVDLGRVGEA